MSSGEPSSSEWQKFTLPKGENEPHGLSFEHPQLWQVENSAKYGRILIYDASEMSPGPTIAIDYCNGQCGIPNRCRGKLEGIPNTTLEGCKYNPEDTWAGWESIVVKKGERVFSLVLDVPDATQLQAGTHALDHIVSTLSISSQ